jgi:hypothetical protein
MIETSTPSTQKGSAMTLTEHSTVTEHSTADFIAGAETPQHHPHEGRIRRVVSWVVVGVAVISLVLLVVRFLASDDEPPAPTAPAAITDAKDRPGYRSPTAPLAPAAITDAKDRPGYRSPTAPLAPAAITDAKDRPGYRSPTARSSIIPV